MEVLNIPTTTTTTTTAAINPTASSDYSNNLTSTATSPFTSFPSMPTLPFQKSSMMTSLTASDSYQADLLKCGSCLAEFFLSDIVIFIQHKTKSCKQQAGSSSFTTDYHNGANGSEGYCCNHTCSTSSDNNSLACSSCLETFKSPKSLLEHAQFAHKINIFIENKASSSSSLLSPASSSAFKPKSSATSSPSSSSASSTCLLPKVSSSSSIYNKKTSHHHINSFDGLDFSIGTGGSGHHNSSSGGLSSSSSTSNSKTSGNSKMTTNTTNEIFIDVIPSSMDRRNSMFDKSQSYNITFSSSLSPSSTSSSMPKSRSVNSHLNIISSTSSFSAIDKQKSELDNENGAKVNSARDKEGDHGMDAEKSLTEQNNELDNENDDYENENHSSGNDYCNLESASSNRGMGQHRNRISLSFQNENSSSSSSSSASSSRSSSASSTSSAHSGTLTLGKYDDENDHHQLIHSSSSKLNGNTPTKSEPFEHVSSYRSSLSHSNKGAQNDENGLQSFSSNSEKMANDGARSESGLSQGERKKDGKKSKQTASFYCDVCSAAFNQKIHLTKHSAKHTGIKPFKCSECSYSTVERSHLKVHVRVHTGEKPFKCTFCEYATAQSSTLKIHKKRHHNNANELKSETLNSATNAASTSSTPVNIQNQSNDNSKQEPTSSSTASSPTLSEMSNEEYLTKKKIAAKRQLQSKSKESNNQKSSKKLCNINMTQQLKNANNNSNNYLSSNVNTSSLVSNHNLNNSSSSSNNNTPVPFNLNTNLANMTPNSHIYTSSFFFPDIHAEADSPLNNSSQNIYKILDLWSKSTSNPANVNQTSSAINISNLQANANMQSKFFESINTMLMNSMAANNKSNMAAASASMAGLSSAPTSAILNPSYFANNNNSSILLGNGGNMNNPVVAAGSSSNRGFEGLNDPFAILKENRFNSLTLNPLLSNVRFNNLLTVSADTNVDRKNDKSLSSSSPSSSSSSQQQTPTSSSSLSPSAASGGESSSESSENKLLGLANIALEREIN